MKAQMYNYSSWINETDPIILKTQFENQLIKSGFCIISIQEKFYNYSNKASYNKKPRKF